MKSVIAALFCTLSAGAFAQYPSPARQECNLIAATISNTASWRDNGVPLSTSQRNVEQAFANSSVGLIATDEDRQKWRNTVRGIYESNLTSGQLFDLLKTSCKTP